MRRQDEMGAVRGFRAAPPGLAARLVGRPDALAGIVRTLRSRERFVAVTGVGGAGKSTLAAQACADRSVRRAFRDGIAWLEACPRQDPMALIASVANRVGLSDAAVGFVAVEQGREQLMRALRSRRLLIVVDDVRERPPLDAFADLPPSCTVLFTTKLPELAAAVKATEIQVGPFTREQALELLGRCTARDPAALPGTARALCAQLGELPLGVALAGGVAAHGRSFEDVLNAFERTPARPGADEGPDRAQDDRPAPAQEYQILFRAIEAAIADLAEADQRRYEQLAVFAARGPFPRDAARVLWQPGMPDARVDDLLAELADRSLLTVCGADSYTAHDLQYDVLIDRLGRDRLAAAHARLLDGYRLRYPAGWASSAADPYLAGQLAGQLHDALLDEELRKVLIDVAWIEARLIHGHAYDLIADYGYAGDPLSRQILRTLRLSARSLSADPGLLQAQLASRLLSHPDPGIAAWAVGLIQDVPGHGNGGPPLALVARAPSLVTTARKQALTGHDGSVRGVAVTPDGATAVSGGEDGVARVWDLSGGCEQATLAGHTDWIRSVAVTHDGTRAVSGSDDGSVRVWDLKDGREQASLAGHGRPVWSVAVTPDGSRAVSGGEDGSVRVWDLKDGREQASLAGHGRPVWSVAVTPDGSRAVSGGGDGSVRVWDLKDGREQATFTGHTGEVFAVAVTPDGSRAVSSGGDGSVRVWDLKDGREETVLTGHIGWVWSVAVTPDGARAVSGGEDASVRVWDLRTGREETALTGHPRQVFTVAVTPDGTRAVSGGGDGTVRVWDLARRQPIFAGHVGWVWSAAVTPDGARAVTGGGDGTVRLWDLDTGGELATLTGTEQPVWSVAVTPDASRAVSGGSDRMVRVWDLAAGGAPTVFAGHSRPVWSVAVTADGATAVSGGGDGTVRIWDLAAGRERSILAAHAGEVYAVAVTPDGAGAVSGGADGTVRVWDLMDGRQWAVLPAQQGRVWSVAVTADGARAVTGGADGTVRVWDLKDGRKQAVLTGHAGQVFSVALTPDGAYAVSGGEDASVRLWSLAARSELARWIGEHPIIGLNLLAGQPLRIGVGQGLGPPGLLAVERPSGPAA